MGFQQVDKNGFPLEKHPIRRAHMNAPTARPNNVFIVEYAVEVEVQNHLKSSGESRRLSALPDKLNNAWKTSHPFLADAIGALQSVPVFVFLRAGC
jgi:hypothetical protein